MAKTSQHLAKTSQRLAFYSRTDPTYTLTLRNAFARDLKKRFRELRGVIRRAIVVEDVFGLRDPELALVTTLQMTTPGRRAFAFATDAEKVNQFMDWMDDQVKAGILEIQTFDQLGTAIQQPWTNTYIQSSYQKGIRNARTSLIGTGYNVPGIEDSGGIDAVFNMPFHADRAGLLFTRTFRDLKGITDAMDTQVSRVLAQGMADGLGPRQLARNLTRTISGPVGDLGITDTLGRFIPAERRAVILARSEIIRAHAQAQLQEFENWGVAGVTAAAEFRTAGDTRVCPLCAPIDGRVYTIEQARNIIPVHPQCRCAWLPVDQTVDEIAPSGVRGEFEIPDELKDRIRKSDSHINLLIQPEYDEMFRRAGVSDAKIQKLKDILRAHGGGPGQQRVADRLLVEVLRDTSHELHTPLRLTIEMEEEAYKQWRLGAPVRRNTARERLRRDWEQDPSYMQESSGADSFEDHWRHIEYQFPDKPLKIYRGGDLDKDVQAWTFYEEGASTGVARIRVDHIATVDDMLDEYHVVGGFARMMGAPGEGEITFIRKIARQVDDDVLAPLTTEAAKEEWDRLIERRLALRSEGKWPSGDQIRDERNAYYRWVSTLDEKAYRAERDKKLAAIMETKKIPKKIQQGTDWIPFDMLDKLEREGLAAKVLKTAGRANYREGLKAVTLFKDSGADVVAHEFGHAIDDLVFGRTDFGDVGRISRGTGFLWTDNVYVTEKVGKDFREVFRRTSSGKKGRYTNGDGEYWKDNWIDDYEGRIYRGTGAGDEWWAMNVQRYHKYQIGLDKYDRKVEQIRKDIANSALSQGYRNAREVELSTLEREGRENWAGRLSKWDKAKERYPELTDFIEEKFELRFAIEGIE